MLASGGVMRLSTRSSRSQAALAWAISLAGGSPAGTVGAVSPEDDRIAETAVRVISAPLVSGA